MTDHDEILLLRKRADELDRKLWELESSAGANARELKGIRDELRELSRKVEAMTQAEEMAEAVRGAINQSRSHRWTIAQKVAGGLAAVVLAVPAVHDLASWAHTAPPCSSSSSSSCRR